MEVKLTDVDDKLYSKLYVSSADLSLAAYCTRIILKKGWHHNPWEKRGTIYLQQSVFMSALITAYGRPFTSSHGWPSFPKELMNFSVDELIFHKRIIDLRHSVYAHSASKHYSVRPWRAGDFSTDIVGAPVLRISAEDAVMLIGLINKLQAAICRRMEELVPKAQAVAENDKTSVV